MDYQVPKKMSAIGDLFEKYRQNIKPPQSSVEKEFIAVVKEVTGFDLDIQGVTYTVSTRTISLRIPAVLKTELRFKQGLIMCSLEDRLGKGGCPKVVL